MSGPGSRRRRAGQTRGGPSDLPAVGLLAGQRLAVAEGAHALAPGQVVRRLGGIDGRAVAGDAHVVGPAGMVGGQDPASPGSWQSVQGWSGESWWRKCGPASDCD